MAYRIAVGIFLVFYLLGAVFPMLFGGTGSVIRLIIFSLPVLLVVPRLSQRFSGGGSLLPDAFRNKAGALYGGGIALIWIGHIIFFGSLAFAIYLGVRSGGGGFPIGLLTGYSIFPYLGGIVLVEIAFRQWATRLTEQPWKAKGKFAYIFVGVLVAAQLGFNLADDRPVDLLGYYEREALALGRGYAREVQRAAGRFYETEERIPCADDGYIDPNSLLHSQSRNLREFMSIDLLECGQFVVTIHKPVDGVTDGQLLYTATPGDADAGQPLNWQCRSAHHERIARHTRDECTYDPSLASSLPAPSAAPVARPAMERRPTLASASAARAPSTTPSPSTPPSPSPTPRARPAATAPTVQARLDRLSEPMLWEECGADKTAYRFMRFDGGDYVAAVRISRDSGSGAFHSVTSSSPDSTIGLDGYVDDRKWAQLEAAFSAADFWNLESTRGSSAMHFYLEGCRDGTYHAVQRDGSDPRVASIASQFASVGRLEWLEN